MHLFRTPYFYSTYNIIRKLPSFKNYFGLCMVDFIYNVRHKTGNRVLDSGTFLSGEIKIKGTCQEI
jgi:hypothetical protein